MIGLSDRLDMTGMLNHKSNKKIKTMQPAFYSRFSAFHFRVNGKTKDKNIFLISQKLHMLHVLIDG